MREAAARGAAARAAPQPPPQPPPPPSSSSDRPTDRRSHRIGMGTRCTPSATASSSASSTALLGASKEAPTLPLSSRYRSVGRPRRRHRLPRSRHALSVARLTPFLFFVRDSFVSSWARRRRSRWGQSYSRPPLQEQSHSSSLVFTRVCLVGPIFADAAIA